MHKLVAAVSNAGGLGVIERRTSLRPRRPARRNPQDARADRRQAVRRLDLLDDPIPDMMRPHVPVMIEEKVKVFVAGLSVPQEFLVKVMHDNGMKIVVMCGKVHHGVKSQQAGADVVVAQVD